jgi:hypothetical protein
MIYTPASKTLRTGCINHRCINSYIMDRSATLLTDRCRFLNCSARIGGGGRIKGVEGGELEGENKRGGGEGVGWRWGVGGGEVCYQS